MTSLNDLQFISDGAILIRIKYISDICRGKSDNECLITMNNGENLTFSHSWFEIERMLYRSTDIDNMIITVDLCYPPIEELNDNSK